MREINQDGLDLIKHFEGLRLTSYKCPADVWTIGYGTTTRAGVGIIVEEGMTITEDDAETYLRRALDKFSDLILPHMTRLPTENQYAAMLSLAYNIGPVAFKKSTCLKRFNAGDIDGAAEALTWFNKAGGKVLQGLVRRRAAEHDLFLKTDASDPPLRIEADEERTNPAQSTTIQASAAAAVSGATGVATAVSALDGTAQIVIIAAACVAGLALLWIMNERLRRWAAGDK